MTYKIDYTLHISLFWGLAIASILLLISPDLFLQFDFTCLFRRLTHLNCPFCGMTRDFVALAKGNPSLLNPFSPLAFFSSFILYPFTIVALAFRGPVVKVNYQFVQKLFSLTMLLMLILNNLK